MLICQHVGQAGIKTVLGVDEYSDTDGSDFPLVTYVPEAKAIVSVGNQEEIIQMPAVSRVLGGEDKADTRPLVKTGMVGPGVLLQKCLGDSADVVATVICGDSYFGEHPEDAAAEVLKLIAAHKPDLVIAGPAF